MKQDARQTVVVIGGGPAGLSCAYELVSRGEQRVDVVVLEAGDAFGGISRTVVHNGNRMDIGGHRFFSKEERVNAWWEALLPLQGAKSYDDKVLERECALSKGGPDPEQTDNVMLSRNRISRIFFGGKFFDYPISLSLPTLRAMGITTTLGVGFDYLKAQVRQLPETNLENFYINRFGRKLYGMFFEKYTEKLWGIHPKDIAADWGAQRVKGISVAAVLKDAVSKFFGHKNDAQAETSLIEHFLYPKLGPGQLWEAVADKIEQGGGQHPSR